MSDVIEPLVSVIIPVYNGEKYLSETLDSVTAQTYTPYEIVLVDDGSTDGGAAIAKIYPSVRYFFQKNSGIAAARNRAIEVAKGDLVAFLDQDDLWTPNKLKVQVRYALEHPEVALVLAREKLFFSDGYYSEFVAKHLYMGREHLSLVPGVWLIRREALKVVGGMDGAYKLADDVDWLMRFFDAGYRYGFVDETVLHKRIHGENASLKLHVAIDEILTAFRASIHRRRETGIKRVMEG